MIRARGVGPIASAVFVVVTTAPIACSSESAEPARSVEQHDAGAPESSTATTATTDSGSADGDVIVEDGGPNESPECFLRIGGQVFTQTTCHAPKLLGDDMVVQVSAGSSNTIQISVLEPPSTGTFDAPSIDGRVLFFRRQLPVGVQNIEGKVTVVHAGQPDDLYEGSANGRNVTTDEEVEVRWRFKGPSYPPP